MASAGEKSHYIAYTDPTIHQGKCPGCVNHLKDLYTHCPVDFYLTRLSDLITNIRSLYERENRFQLHLKI